MDQKFVVSNSPFVRSKNDLNRLLWYTAIVLLFPLVYGIVIFGFKSLIVVLISVGSCALFEALYNLFDQHKFKIYNISFLITGLILALSLPVNIPIVVLVISDFFAIIVVKMVFGGLGRNIFNPACTARCLAGLILPSLTAELYTTTFSGDEYISVAAGGTNTLQNMMAGKAVGNIGTTCIVVMLICLCILAYLKIIEAKLPIISILSFIVIDFILTHSFDMVAINICSGSFIFVSIFMLTEPNTSPNTLLGKILYSFAFGSLSAIVWNMGFLGENTAFAVALFINIFVPFMDKYLVSRPTTLGGFRNAYKN